MPTGGRAPHSRIPGATVPLDVVQEIPPHVDIPFLRRGGQTRIFSGAQNNDWAHWSALSASAAKHTMFSSTEPVSFGMGPTLPTAPGTTRAISRIQMEPASVTTGKGQMDVQAPHRHTEGDTNVQVAEKQATELRCALARRRQTPLTPYKAEAWKSHLIAAGLISKYPSILEGLVNGFIMGFPKIVHTFAPSNHLYAKDLHKYLMQNINHELEVGWYIGPFRRGELEELIGPFQSSPLSIIPKPGKPGKYRIIQNFSFPYSPRDNDTQSINSQVNPDDFPCTWGTFNTICQVVRHLPPGSQAAVRDVAEAYQTILLYSSQWPGAVVRISEESLVVDTNLGFGYGPAAGGYGHLGDAAADIMRSCGIGPLSKWVDDTIFFRIPRSRLEGYNALRGEWARCTREHGGRIQDGCRVWYQGSDLPNGTWEEFDEDFTFQLRDLSDSSDCWCEDRPYTYSMQDIDKLSDELGIPWERSKDVPFSSTPPYLGFIWDLAARTVSLSPQKREKYMAATKGWEARHKHTLEQVQSLHGKLLHATLVLPMGRAYLTNLESMLSIFGDSPHHPRAPPRECPANIRWWKHQLTTNPFTRSVLTPGIVDDPNAFSDVSLGIGIAIWIDGQWRAWKLKPGWKSEGRDIGWAEAIGFELLVKALVPRYPTGASFKVFRDNQGVVEGWKIGRSRNKQVNCIFKRIHKALTDAQCQVISRYVRSAQNLADGPLRGVYPPVRFLLPEVHLPEEVRPYLSNI
jgi:hypothetical protein